LATYVAVVAEVEIERKSARIRVPRAFAAADAGQNINPDGLANQIEGGMIQSTSWTLHEAVGFDRDGTHLARLERLSDPDHAGSV
jgi:CO/xanthine dehydrogenase Mo-binding subunit